MSLAENKTAAISENSVPKDENLPGGDAPETPPEGERSYLQIFKSSATIAGSSLVGLVFSVVRNKAAAVWLGPDGVGLIGLFWSIIEFTQGLAGSGLLSAGVRQIAEANGAGDSRRVAATASALHWLSLGLGLLGAAILVIFALPISTVTFGNTGFAVGVALVSLAVLLRILAFGQIAALQGLRRIGDLARVHILTAVLGALCFVCLIWTFGKQGIVPALIIDAGLLAALGWWFARKIDRGLVPLRKQEITAESRAILRLGLVFMVNGLFVLGAAYAVRIIVTTESGLAAAGLYQAAWAIASLYAGFILQAMGVDFYPRLTEVAHDNQQCNRLVNEQTQVSILLAGPGLIATLTLAPFVVHLFYSAEFNPAVDILRWFCLGMMLRIISWPMGFIILAKNEQRLFFWTELAAALVQVGLAWLLVKRLGPVGAGAAFFGLYIWHTLIVWVIAKHLSGFRWSQINLQLGALYVAASAIVCAGFFYLDGWLSLGLGLAVTAACSIHSLYALLTLVPEERFPAMLRRFLPKAR
ncbi:MAG: O-antigen translocase [Rhizobiaceae bacterium]|nr:O-antigen translocase [Rhizobiaceae bacterium]